MGDIIYAIPTMLCLSQGKNIHLHLNLNQETDYGKMIHPLGNVRLTQDFFYKIKPLLLYQLMIKTCDIMKTGN